MRVLYLMGNYDQSYIGSATTLSSKLDAK